MNRFFNRDGLRVRRDEMKRKSIVLKVRMMKLKLRTILAVLFGLTILLSLGNTKASAQSCTGLFYCGWYSNNSGCIPTPPPTVHDCTTEGPFTAVCQVNTNACAPPPRCMMCELLAAIRAALGSPIDIADGNTYIAETDIRIPGLGGGLSLTRTWNSVWPTTPKGFGSGSSSAPSGTSGVVLGGSTEQNISAIGFFGPNWRSNYEERIYADSDGYMTYSRGDGSFWSFGFAGNSNNFNSFTVVGPANQTATLTQGTTNWTLAFLNGEKRTFDNVSGNLTAIIDRNGNTTQVSYDAAFRIISITDPAGRHLYFAYQNPSSYLITSVTSDAGISLSYSYDSHGRLIQVTKPDQTIVSYEYNSQSLITAVKDSDGKILESHTYDSVNRGLTSSRANGVDAVTVTYPQTPPLKLDN